MRKNYFAKKLIAYSMAFAVAFSTLTVSPVFVKEAKAAAAPNKVEFSDSLTDDSIADGAVWLGEITSDDAVDGTPSTYAELKTKSGLGDKVRKTTLLAAGTTITNTKTNNYTLAGTPATSTNTENVKDIVLDNKTELKLLGATGNSNGYSWFKLVPSKGSYVVTTGTAPNTKNETVSFVYYTLNLVSNDTDYDLGVASSDDLGFYVQASKDGASGFTAITKFYNVCEKSDLSVKVRKDTTYVSLGSEAKLVVDATSTRPVTYTWSKDTKAVACTSNTLTLSNVTKDDLGSYKCVVSDGIKDVPKILKLSETTETVVTGASTELKSTNLETVVKALATTNKLADNNVTINTIIPAGAYKYIWLDDSDNIVEMSVKDVLAYNPSSRSVTITDATNTYDTTSIICYAIPEKTYNETTAIINAQDAIAKTTNDVDKHTAINALRTAEKTLKGSAVYTEEFTLVQNTSKDASFVVYPKLGESLTLTTPTVAGAKSYQWDVNDADSNPITTKDLVKETVDVKDYGVVTCTVSGCNNDPVCTDLSKCTHGSNTLATFTYNILYTPDFTATATEIVPAKVGAEVKFAVDAKSSLPLKYTWSEIGGVTAGTKNTVGNEYTVKPVANADFTTVDKGVATIKYYQCVVTDGVSSKTFKFGIDKVTGFTAKENNTKIAAVKDKTYTLAPTVELKSATAVTYKWFKNTDNKTVISTDPSFTFKYDETPVDYTCVVSDGDNDVTIKYEVKTFAISSTAVVVKSNDVIYNGEEQDPLVLTQEDTNSHTYTLVKDKDYKVTFTSNVNVGVARYSIELIGDFATKSITTGQDKGTFYIDRADNKVEIEDITVLLGESVQPKTVTNLGKGAISYTYYADADCTTALEAVPTTVGTYYAKATAIATANYNEAESNVATVKVLPSKVKMLGTSRTASSVKLNWNKATGATSYRVYYKAPGAKSYKVFKNTTATSMEVTGLTSATTYTFAVKAYAKTAGYSTVYATKQTTTAPAKVATPSVTAGSKKATVKFTKVARATGYEVYMAKGNGSYKKVATTKNLSFTKTGLTKGSTYKFKVRAYKTVGSNTYYGAFSSAKAVVVK